MLRHFIYYFVSLLYMELVYHFSSFGFVGLNPLLMIPGTMILAAFEACLTGIAPKKVINRTVFWVISAVNYLLFASQEVYYAIFKKPLLVEVAVHTGAAALTDFWQVALEGIAGCIPVLLLMALPMVAAGFLMKQKIIGMKQYKKLDFAYGACGVALGITLSALVLVVGYVKDTEFYGVYQEMYDPEMVARGYGVIPLFERQFMGELLPGKGISADALGQMQGTEESTEIDVEEVPGYDTSPNVLNIDMDALMANGNNVAQLAQMMQNMTPTKKNEYTGMFEGYNLIYITAEAFSQYAIHEELTPTLYKMVNSGIVVKDYYIPLWATSTSDGEYVNLTGQIPDGQHSFRRTQYNSQPYSLPAYFAAEGVKSFAYHNNSLSYYDRYLTHPNMGYDFKAAKLGSLSASEWQNKIFPMENPGYWPTSDYEMMVSTIPEWINEERFHAYYMTVSGHCNYNFPGNKMASVNKDVVANLEVSDEWKAYIACNYELEKAMTYLLQELENAGKLANTVIVLSADHHPYGMSEAGLTECAGKQLNDIETYQNCLIMWNSEMETINVEKTCSAMDIMPTLMNLFGFEYDSRLFPGRDMLSEASSLVVFSNRSFITDTVIYNAKTKEVISRTGEEVSQEYVDGMREYVKALFKYSAGILNDDFFKYVHEAEITTE